MARETPTDEIRDEIREALDILRTDTRYDPDVKEWLDIVTTAIDQYAELLAYVDWLERMLVPGTKDRLGQGRMEWRPTWLDCNTL